METARMNSISQFLIVWAGQLISNIGSGLTAFTLGVFVYQRTHSATSYALIMFFSFLPALLLKPIGGVLADRFDRRLMMIIGDLGSALGLVFILSFLVSGNLALWQIYAGAAISSAFTALHNPAYKASVSDFVSEDMYARASGLMQLAATSQFLISPIIAGLLFAVMDIKYIIMIDILSFLIAVLAVFWVRQSQVPSRTQHPEQRFLRELKDGLLTITVNGGLVVLVAITAVLCFYMGFIQTLMGPMLLNFIDPRSFGIAQSICATGLLVSSLLIGVFGGTKNHVTTMSLSLALVGLFYALIGVTSNVYLIVIFGFLFFFGLAFVQTSLEVLIRQNVANEKQGRVWSLISVVTQLGYPAAYGLAGPLADRVFNPLLLKDGPLASTVGRMIGTGPGRGIGFMFVICGVLVMLLAATAGRIRAVRALESAPASPTGATV